MGATNALIVAALVILAVLMLRRTSIARRDVRDAEARLARRFYLLQGRVAEIDVLVRELEFERRRQRGEIRFAPSTRLQEALAVHPRVREILAGFGITGSGCSGGSLDESRTLAETCAASSLDTRVVLDALRRFLEDPAAPVETKASAARIYRIQARPEVPR